jgi:hypothetical protein
VDTIIIVGCVCGFVVAILTIVLVVLCLRKCRSAKQYEKPIISYTEQKNSGSAGAGSDSSVDLSLGSVDLHSSSRELPLSRDWGGSRDAGGLDNPAIDSTDAPPPLMPRVSRGINQHSVFSTKLSGSHPQTAGRGSEAHQASASSPRHSSDWQRADPHSRSFRLSRDPQHLDGGHQRGSSGRELRENHHNHVRQERQGHSQQDHSQTHSGGQRDSFTHRASRKEELNKYESRKELMQESPRKYSIKFDEHGHSDKHFNNTDWHPTGNKASDNRLIENRLSATHISQVNESQQNGPDVSDPYKSKKVIHEVVV